jgi:hypothetical protein
MINPNLNLNLTKYVKKSMVNNLAERPLDDTMNQMQIQAFNKFTLTTSIL